MDNEREVQPYRPAFRAPDLSRYTPEAEIVVEDNIPVPELVVFTASPMMLAIRGLEVGQSIKLNTKADVKAAHNAQRRNDGTKYTIRLLANEPGKYRVWRVQ